MNGVENQAVGTRPDRSLPAHSRHSTLTDYRLGSDLGTLVRLQTEQVSTPVSLILQRRDAA
ncbi:hypothetical protein PSCICL_39030 [Pseudomonas cichorii]|nr:hypothetical protein PSCICF_37730 [Pseudomonas cichorii]GFM62799.1 hypothetical protein PSCICG_39590 [Pseudomonas cichorii]GFM72911.1 hypothetical protein PSCICL_39030 [Pseudomonas cichorii]